ncbi:MAG: glycosyltransferase family 8 protein [Bacteroidales bacterium]|nr:glycosyltransferase family 8 protein [Bacteroidales bacterium]
MHTVPILFTFDDKLIMPACVCLTSLMESASADTFYDIFILHADKYDFKDSDLMKIPAAYPNCKITFRAVSGQFMGAYEIRGIPETCYYRLLSPELIPEYDKLLYSDVDVIVRDDLTKYYEMDLGDNYFGGVDTGSRLREWIQNYCTKTLNIDWHKGYHYSGNLVINSKQILKDNKIAEFKELAKKDWFQQDMDIINIACTGRFKRLSPAYCMTNFLYGLMVNQRDEMVKDFGEQEVEYALKKGIVHYNGDKPWKTWCHHYDIWWEYYRKSPIFDEKWYMDFYESKFNELDKLPLMKRIKILARYFIVGRK